jgi:hypothetical protein
MTLRITESIDDKIGSESSAGREDFSTDIDSNIDPYTPKPSEVL